MFDNQLYGFFYVHWSTQYLYKTGMFDTQCLTHFMFFFYVHVKYTISLHIYFLLLQNKYVWYTMFNQLNVLFYVHVKYTIFLQIYSRLLQNRSDWYTQCLTNFFSKKRKEIRSYAFIVCLILVTIFLRYSSDRFNTYILLMLKNSFHFNSENIILKDYALNTQSSMEKGA